MVILRTIRSVALAAASLGLCAAAPMVALPPADRLERVVVVMRHGVRAAMSSPDALSQWNGRRWPAFAMPAGHRTPKGGRFATLLGRYYRDRYRAAGLVGSADCSVCYWADLTLRTHATAAALVEGLLPPTMSGARSAEWSSTAASGRHGRKGFAAAKLMGAAGGVALYAACGCQPTRRADTQVDGVTVPRAEGVDAPAAWLTRVVARLCLDHLKSARIRRETYVGAWLPEPLLGTTGPDEQGDDLTVTLMLAMERLSPLERAAFRLYDVFDVDLPEVAGILDRAPATVRQLASRARRHVAEARPRYPVDAKEGARITRAFFAAARDGDARALSELLANDVAIHSDGGGRVPAFRNVIRGLGKAQRLFAGLRRKYRDAPIEFLRFATIDGLPGYVSRTGGSVLQTAALDIRDGRIVAIYVVRNPDKVTRVAATRPSRWTFG